MNSAVYNLHISKKFLKELNGLSKMAIKVYLSLAFIKQKRGKYFAASHREISVNVFDDKENYLDSDYFGIRTDHGQYFKAFKNLEALGLIKVYRDRTKNGGYKVNKYRVY